MCNEIGVPCVVPAGTVDQKAAFLGQGVTAAFSLCDGPMTLEESINRTGELIAAAANGLQAWMARGPKISINA